MLQLKNHPVWQDLSEIINSIDVNALVIEHLELCDRKIAGYWDESDNFYEKIILPRTLSAELISSAIAFYGEKRRIQLKFRLKVGGQSPEETPDSTPIGELMLSYDENLEFVDENWQIDLNSPWIEAKRES